MGWDDLGKVLHLKLASRPLYISSNNHPGLANSCKVSPLPFLRDAYWATVVILHLEYFRVGRAAIGWNLRVDFIIERLLQYATFIFAWASN